MVNGRLLSYWRPLGSLTPRQRGYQPGDRVYRWWYSLPNDPDPQPLTVVRINRKTITVRTDLGAEFRMDPKDIAGHWRDDKP